jgi:hypothetical protein
MRRALRAYWLIACAFWALSATATWAAKSPSFVDGHALWEYCGQTTAGEPPRTCTAYVEGVVDQYVWTVSIMHGRSPFCLAAAADPGSVTDVVRKYLSDHPNEREFIAPALVFSALLEAYPACPAPPSDTR